MARQWPVEGSQGRSSTILREHAGAVEPLIGAAADMGSVKQSVLALL
jgi:hypothetical protein